LPRAAVPGKKKKNCWEKKGSTGGSRKWRRHLGFRGGEGGGEAWGLLIWGRKGGPRSQEGKGEGKSSRREEGGNSSLAKGKGGKLYRRGRGLAAGMTFYIGGGAS